jgi:molybdate transport system substrate-binding protein
MRQSSRLRSLARTSLGMLCLAMLLAACGAPTAAPNAPAPEAVLQGELVVFAAASLTDAFTSLGEEFQSEYPGTSISFNFANSQQLAAQINEGAPADVFASANYSQMAQATSSGRISEGTETLFVRNRLVVITPADNPADLTSLNDLARPGLRLVLADQVTPVGQYTLDFLERASASAEFELAYGPAVLANVVSFENTVRAVLAKVQLGEADAGIVYSSDVALDRSQVTLIDIPDQLNTLAEYPIAPLNDTTNPALAAAFVEFVLSPQGQAILANYGFQALATSE